MTWDMQAWALRSCLESAKNSLTLPSLHPSSFPNSFPSSSNFGSQRANATENSWSVLLCLLQISFGTPDGIKVEHISPSPDMIALLDHLIGQFDGPLRMSEDLKNREKETTELSTWTRALCTVIQEREKLVREKVMGSSQALPAPTQEPSPPNSPPGGRSPVHTSSNSPRHPLAATASKTSIEAVPSSPTFNPSPDTRPPGSYKPNPSAKPVKSALKRTTVPIEVYKPAGSSSSSSSNSRTVTHAPSTIPPTTNPRPPPRPPTPISRINPALLEDRFEVDDAVLAKFPGLGWWPARILSPEMASFMEIGRSKMSPLFYLVQSLSEDEGSELTAYLPPDRVKPLTREAFTNAQNGPTSLPLSGQLFQADLLKGIAKGLKMELYTNFPDPTTWFLP